MHGELTLQVLVSLFGIPPGGRQEVQACSMNDTIASVWQGDIRSQHCEDGVCLWLQDLSDVAAGEVRHAFKVAAFCLGSPDFGGQGAGKVAEQQVLARHRQPQQPVQESPVHTLTA